MNTPDQKAPQPNPEIPQSPETVKPHLLVKFDGTDFTITTNDTMRAFPSAEIMDALAPVLRSDEWTMNPTKGSLGLKIWKKFLAGPVSEADKQKVQNTLQKLFGQTYELRQE